MAEPTTGATRLGRALRGVPALLEYLFLCIVETLAIGVFMFAVTLSASGLLFTALAIALAALAPPLAALRSRAILRDPRLRPFAGVVVLALVCALVPGVDGHVGALPFTLAAGLAIRWARGYRARHEGGGEPRWAPVAWVAAAYVGSWMLTSNFLFLVLVALLASRRRVFQALVRRERHGWIRTGVAVAGVAAFLAVPTTFHPMPAECLDATRSSNPPKTVDEGTVTVALLGDSSTEAILLPGTMSYGALLEERLNATRPERPFRVVNCAFSGAATSHLAEQFEHALAYGPAIVSIYMGDNDEWAQGAYEPELLRPRYRAHVEDILAKSREHGIRPLIVTPPSGRPWGIRWIRDMRELSLAIGRERGVEVVDAEGEIGSRLLPALYFVADLGHPNALGHAIVARMLADQILSGAPPAR